MGKLFSSMNKKFWSYFSPLGEKQNIILSGLDAAGKTSIIYKLKLNEYFMTQPIKFHFNVETVRMKKVTIHCWDVGGEDKIRPLFRHYFRDCTAVIYVVDANDSCRQPEAWDELRKSMSDEFMSKDNPVLIFLNKSDLPNAISPMEFVNKFNFSSFFKSNRWFVQPCCALTGDGLFEGLDWLANCIKGFPPTFMYHCKHIKYFVVLRKIYELGWEPKTHLLFPKKYREQVWNMILISDRLGLCVDTMRVILSFLKVDSNDSVEEMEKISEFFEKNLKCKFRSIPVVEKALKSNYLY